MAAPEESEERADEATGAPEPCSPCRGTGKVISNLGEKREELTCPWCEGGGVRIPEHDAQAHFKGEGGEWAAAAAASEAAAAASSEALAAAGAETAPASADEPPEPEAA